MTMFYPDCSVRRKELRFDLRKEYLRVAIKKKPGIKLNELNRGYRTQDYLKCFIESLGYIKENFFFKYGLNKDTNKHKIFFENLIIDTLKITLSDNPPYFTPIQVFNSLFNNMNNIYSRGSKSLDKSNELEVYKGIYNLLQDSERVVKRILNDEPIIFIPEQVKTLEGIIDLLKYDQRLISSSNY